jgi:hypothetical protein
MCSGYWLRDPDPSEYTPAVGPQMSALNLFNANLLHPAYIGNGNVMVASNSTGGISLGDPNAGSGQLPIPRYVCMTKICRISIIWHWAWDGVLMVGFRNRRRGIRLLRGCLLG